MEPHRIISGQVIFLTQEEITAQETADTLAAANQYIEDRAQAFLSLGDQLDLLFHELEDTGTITKNGAWANHVRKVKLDHPKPQV